MNLSIIKHSFSSTKFREYEFIVEKDKRRERLDVYLRRLLKSASRSRIKRLIDEKKIFVDENHPYQDKMQSAKTKNQNDNLKLKKKK